MKALNTWSRRVGIGIVLLGLAWLAWRTHRPGHYWGDDFALYLRQGASLFGDLAVRDVIADNQYMLDHSYKSDFSPPVYPWGWPLILSVPMALGGLDVGPLMMVSLGLFVVALATFYVFASQLVNRLWALVGTMLVGTSPIYIDWSELLHSELPYMCFVFAALYVIDRTQGTWTTSWPGGVMVGLLAAGAFSVRREGLALLVAIGLVLIVARSQGERGWRWASASPLMAFSAAVLLLELILPSTLVPRYPENSVFNLFRYANVIMRHMGEMIGLDNSAAGWALFVVGLLGWGLALRSDWRKHLPIVGYLVVVILIGGSFFIPSGRYFSTAVPLLVLGVLLIPTTVLGGEKRTGRLTATVLAVFLLALLIWLNGISAVKEGDRAEQFGDVVKEGPNRADAVEMFAAVRTETAEAAVIGFFKARSMTLYTDRRAVQINEADPLNPGSEFDVLVVRRSEIDDEDRVAIDQDFIVEWSNETFELLTRK